MDAWDVDPESFTPRHVSSTAKWRKAFEKVKKELGKATRPQTQYSKVCETSWKSKVRIFGISLLLHESIFLGSFKFSSAEARVETVLQAVRAFNMPLQERELAILSSTMVELEQKYQIDAFTTPLVIQVDPFLSIRCIRFVVFPFWISMISRVTQNMFLNKWVSVMPKDQNFSRQRFVHSNPNIVCCLIPNGKYVLTAKWRLLDSQARFVAGLEKPSTNQLQLVMMIYYFIWWSTLCSQNSFYQYLLSHSFKHYHASIIPNNYISSIMSNGILIICLRSAFRKHEATWTYYIQISIMD